MLVDTEPTVKGSCVPQLLIQLQYREKPFLRWDKKTCLVGLVVCSNTVLLYLPGILELNEIPCLIPSLLLWSLWDMRKIWWSLVNDWWYRFPKLIFLTCVKVDSDDFVSKSQKMSLKFPLNHLAHAMFPHPFKHIPLPLSFQLTRLQDATVSTWVNGLSQAVSYLSSFCCWYLRSSERWESPEWWKHLLAHAPFPGEPCSS